MSERAATRGRHVTRCAAVLLVTFVFGCSRAREETPAPSGPSPSLLSGRWVRPDGGYILQISEPQPDQTLTAAYFNPQPINVSRAEWKHEGGYLGVFIELKAPNYPGSTYTLAYDEAQDRLIGIYYQAALQQQFDVEFQRAP